MHRVPVTCRRCVFLLNTWPFIHLISPDRVQETTGSTRCGRHQCARCGIRLRYCKILTLCTEYDAAPCTTPVHGGRCRRHPVGAGRAEGSHYRTSAVSDPRACCRCQRCAAHTTLILALPAMLAQYLHDFVERSCLCPTLRRASLSCRSGHFRLRSAACS